MRPDFLAPQIPINILIILVPLLTAFILDRLLKKVIRVPKHLDSPKTRTYLSLISSVFTIIIYLTAIYFIFILLNINVTPIFASAGIIGVVVGLGVRPFIEDFFIGIFILTQDTINIGDYVEVGNAQGTVETISLRTLNIKDENGAVHIFPNREIRQIVNFSRRKARVIIDIPVKEYKDIDSTIELFNDVVIELKQKPEYSKSILEGSGVKGIEEIQSDGTILIRTIIVTHPASRFSIGRSFRYYLLKKLEKTG